jgi:hypothetical protein
LNEFQRLVREELRVHQQPPVDGLVEGALRGGRRVRRVRRLAAVATGLCLAVLTVLVVRGTVASSANAVADPSPSASSVAPPVIVPVPATGPKVTATMSGALEVLLKLLPPGKTDHYAGQMPEPHMIIIHLHLTTEKGTGMVVLNLSTNHYLLGAFDPSGRCSPEPFELSCSYRSLPDGTKIHISRVKGNCTESTVVFAERVDGTSATVFIPTCLYAFNHGVGPPAPQVLTEDQAVSIVANPALAWSMASSLVEAGAGHFPSLSDIG